MLYFISVTVQTTLGSHSDTYVTEAEDVVHALDKVIKVFNSTEEYNATSYFVTEYVPDKHNDSYPLTI